MVERSFSVPESLAGATPEEVAAMMPEGWIIRPFPDGRTGFQMLDPGKLPGGLGSISYHDRIPDYLSFTSRPPAELFVLNESLECPTLSTLARSFTDDIEGTHNAGDLRSLTTAAAALVRSGHVRVWEDSLGASPAVLLRERQARAAVLEHPNWFREETDAGVARATSVFMLDTTAKGRSSLQNFDGTLASLRL
jgi:hypothetical protein